MRRGTIALHLTEATNHYQQLLRMDAASAAARSGFSLDVAFCALGVIKQIQLLYEVIHRPPALRPRAIVVMPARDGTLRDEAREAARAGIAWIVLNRRASFLEDLPREFPGVPMFTVTPDDVAIGKIQGGQLRAQLARGARVLLVRGSATTATAVDREAGLRQALQGSEIQVDVVDGGWTLDGAQKALDTELRAPGARRSRFEAIVCQNDEMAVGTARALEAAARELGRDDLGKIRIFGCDGLPSEGQRYVKEGRFAATVLVPSTAGPALDALARALDGTRPPLELLLPSKPFPSLPGLAA
jgi:ABC-type sugar transport system substrate-binding protein